MRLIVCSILPGVAVGVVSDQELVWATGFGLRMSPPERR